MAAILVRKFISILETSEAIVSPETATELFARLDIAAHVAADDQVSADAADLLAIVELGVPVLVPASTVARWKRLAQ